MIELEKNKLHFMTPGDCVEVIAKYYLDGLNTGWDIRNSQCYYLAPSEEANDELRPKCDAADTGSSCAIGTLLRHNGVTPTQLWDEGIRNEHPADRVADAYDIRIADWEPERVGRFLQYCQQLHDQFASNAIRHKIPTKALGFMFRLMLPTFVKASEFNADQYNRLFAGDVNNAIRNAFNR